MNVKQLKELKRLNEEASWLLKELEHQPDTLNTRENQLREIISEMNAVINPDEEPQDGITVLNSIIKTTKEHNQQKTQKNVIREI